MYVQVPNPIRICLVFWQIWSCQTRQDRWQRAYKIFTDIKLGVVMQVLVMTSSVGVMTITFVNQRLTGLVCWAIAAGIVSINMSLIYSFVQQNLPHDWWIILLVIIGVVTYLLFIIYLTFGPNK